MIKVEKNYLCEKAILKTIESVCNKEALACLKTVTYKLFVYKSYCYIVMRWLRETYIEYS